MIQVARLAPRTLKDSLPLVERFFLDQQDPKGGFRDRDGRSDLYYTTFGLDGLWALTQPGTNPFATAWNLAGEYLGHFLDRGDLDLVHLCCVARGLATLREGPAGREQPAMRAWQGRMGDLLERFRARDGGYHPKPGQDFGTAYGSFLVLGAYQDCGQKLPQPEGVRSSLRHLQTVDGAWGNERGLRAGATNATAAAMTVLRQLGVPMPPSATQWLLARRHVQGGFTAAPQAPLPDLLSTATALHALAGEQVPLDNLREPCLDFIDSLWTNAGAFHGHWADDHVDVEYTFYGLLALGHLGA